MVLAGLRRRGSGGRVWVGFAGPSAGLVGWVYCEEGGEVMSEERELYELRYQVECMVPIMERIATALEKLAPQGSERERIALQFCLLSTGTCTSEWSFSMADHWLKERDLQRSIQAMREAERRPGEG